jgi:pre-rRNA-processing protein TSR4
MRSVRRPSVCCDQSVLIIYLSLNSYELKGTPLPYSSDNIFLSLFPSPPSTGPAVTHVTKAAFQPPTPKRAYFPNSSIVPNCPICRSKRVFECQLMPNLINVLRKQSTNTASQKITETDEERRKAVEKALKGGSDSDSDMDWGSCLIFSCEIDCCLNGVQGAQAKECWREELVLIQSAL